MSTTAEKQTYGFQAEVKQLLQLVINSLYSNKEIFLRELISNGADAAEKLRFAALSDASLMEDDGEFHIRVSFDKENRTITVADNGVGMSRDEVVENLGTIAKSGTKQFLESLTGDKAKDSKLIGQFGVGFYSAFVVADEITVKTRKAGSAADEAISWQSRGEGEYTVESITKAGRGTEITLHLREGEDEFLDRFKLKNIITRYSDHIAIPVQMHKIETDDDGNETVTDEWETINKAKALWLRPKSEISEEEYKEFYKHIAHDFNDPLLWSHNQVEGNLEYTTLLYIPKNKPFDMWDRERKSALQLYVQRVFITDDAEILPSYLRFVKGIVDSNDLPLNVSRELLQHNRVLEKIKKATTKKVLDTLTRLSKDDPEKYEQFWGQFGQILKEGPVEDHSNQEKLSHLLRFASTHTDTDKQEVALEEYVGRMKENQKYIYYVTAESFAAAKNNPQLEIFRKNGVEVLLMYDRVDEWLMSHLSEYQGKSFKCVSKGDLDLEELEDDQEKEEQKDREKQLESVTKQMKESLGDKVEDVRVSHRLTDSPSCIVVNDYGMSMHLQKLMAEAGQGGMGAMGGKPILEINPDHNFIKQLESEQDEQVFSDWSNLLFNQAILAEGGQLEDPASFVKLVNRYMNA